MTQELLKRINFLAKKSREEGLTEEEKLEQAQLRAKYVQSFRQGLEKENFVSAEFANEVYPTDDIHKLYVGEIVKVLEK